MRVSLFGVDPEGFSTEQEGLRVHARREKGFTAEVAEGRRGRAEGKGRVHEMRREFKEGFTTEDPEEAPRPRGRYRALSTFVSFASFAGRKGKQHAAYSEDSL